jgi:hypothetical protein
MVVMMMMMIMMNKKLTTHLLGKSISSNFVEFYKKDAPPV